ncbi:hypothetical protein IAD21_06377 [Abditibacteriota bacterium]|nr:hypothetical protein IAD21_06377 [Abditibacteriota bacterium]
MKTSTAKSFRSVGFQLGFAAVAALTVVGMRPASAQEPTLDVHLQLQRIRCIDEGDGIGSAEPYFWAVFFKIDGERAYVNPSLNLQGTASVITTLGDHGDLPNHDVDPGEVISIPAAAGGEYTTRLQPLPLRQPIAGMTNTAAAMGCIVVLMEEDNTPGSAVAQGHVALNHAVEDELNSLIPTLGFAKRAPTDEDIKAMKDRIGAAVKKAIKDKVTVADWLIGGGNMDDQIGSDVFLFSTDDLNKAGTAGLAIEKQWNNEGKWKLEGHISAKRIPRRIIRPPFGANATTIKQ